jgi:hypothetical protein
MTQHETGRAMIIRREDDLYPLWILPVKIGNAVKN